MTTATELLEVARKQVGECEYPPGTNNVVYNTNYYGHNVSGPQYPWCCTFVWDVFHRTNASKLFYNGGKTAYVPGLMAWFKGQNRLTKNWQPGDIVFFQFDKDSNPDHVGIIDEVGKGYIYAIEGNTSLTSNDNGGKVMRRKRSNSLVMAVAHPDYEEEEEVKRYDSVKELPDYAIATVNKLIGMEIIKGGKTGLDLSEDMLRLLVFNDRAGLYD